MIELKGFAYWRAVIARWIVIHIAFRISRLGVTHLCLEVADLFNEKTFEDIEVNE